VTILGVSTVTDKDDWEYFLVQMNTIRTMRFIILRSMGLAEFCYEIIVEEAQRILSLHLIQTYVNTVMDKASIPIIRFQPI
jgi:hypothetical protein